MALQVERIKIEDIKAYDGNAKRHTDKQVAGIRRSIEEFGFNDPVAEASGNAQGGTGGGETTKNSTAAASGGKPQGAERGATTAGANNGRTTDGGHENVRPYTLDKRPQDEARRIQRAGGKASGASRSYAAKMRATWQAILDMPWEAGPKTKAKTFTESANENTTVREKVILRALMEYMNTGNPRTLELIMRFSGSEESPAEQAAAVAQAAAKAAVEAQQQADGGLIGALMATGAAVFADETEDQHAE